MTIIQNSFEGGSNGTTLIVSPNNTGGASGDAANQIAGSPTFSNAQAASGSLSLQMPASSVQDSFRWNSLSMTAMKSRFYLYYPTLLGADHWPWQACIGGGATRILTLKVTTGNKLQLTTPAGSVWTAAAAFSAGQWYRAEVYMNGIDTSTATVKVAYFSLHSTAPIDSYDGTGTSNTGSTNIDSVFFGKTNGATIANPFYVDDIAVDTAPSADYVWPSVLPSFTWSTTVAFGG